MERRPQQPTRVLVVDDEEDVVSMLRSNLERAGYAVNAALDGPSALDRAREHPDLILLDVMLPGLTGFEVLRQLKKEMSTALIPVILLTARAAEADRVSGLELGADDYVAKPFSPRELILRIQSILRRTNAAGKSERPRQAGLIAFDEARHQITIRGRGVDLTVVEFKILRVLLEKLGRVFSREQLIAQVWGEEAEIDHRTIDTHIRRLREKLGPAAEQLQTVRGFGYRLDEE
jgi:two-component system phosphate regulon response regulator PhoB